MHTVREQHVCTRWRENTGFLLGTSHANKGSGRGLSNVVPATPAFTLAHASEPSARADLAALCTANTALLGGF